MNEPKTVFSGIEFTNIIKRKDYAIDLAIKYLKQYANDDDDAGLNGSGCYSNPYIVIEKWISEIKKYGGVE